MMTDLQVRPPDPLLKLIKAYREDPRAEKIDLGVGVYRDESGETPIMAAVKEAERRLLATQTTKSYVGAQGDVSSCACSASSHSANRRTTWCPYRRSAAPK